MTIAARMLTQEQDGIPGYIAHPEGPGQRPGVMEDVREKAENDGACAADDQPGAA